MTSPTFRESTLVDKMIAALQRQYGGFVFKVHGGRYQRKGMPDILWWYKGHCFGFEVKRGDAYGTTALQKLKLDKLQSEGVHVGVVKTIDEMMEIIEEVL